MAHSAIEPVASDLYGYLKQSRSLASAARQWLNPAFGPTKPKFSPTYRSTLIEVAFLRSFLAWESFLEESFLLYLLGKKPRKRRRPPKRYVTPRDREHALTLMLPEKGRDFVMWDNPDQVRVHRGSFPQGWRTLRNSHFRPLERPEGNAGCPQCDSPPVAY